MLANGHGEQDALLLFVWLEVRDLKVKGHRIRLPRYSRAGIGTAENSTIIRWVGETKPVTQ